MHARLPRWPLRRPGPLAEAFHALGIDRFDTAAEWVRGLPYGRTDDVLADARGTCSSKHGLLARLGREQGLDVTLMLGLVRLEGPAPVRAVLDAAGVAWVPEAHCWLCVGGVDWDLTFPEVPAGPPQVARLEAVAWDPDQLGEKPAWHRARMAAHLPAGWTVDRLWTVREACIAALSAG